jgi:hypothetical protein
MAGKHSKSYAEVLGTVHKVVRSGDLTCIGARLIEVGAEPEERNLAHCLAGIETLVLVPNTASHAMTHQAEVILRAAKNANVQNCLVMSLVGCEETNINVCKKFKHIEEMAKQSGLNT